MAELGRTLMLLGGLLLVVGPLMTSIVISVILSILMMLFRK